MKRSFVILLVVVMLLGSCGTPADTTSGGEITEVPETNTPETSMVETDETEADGLETEVTEPSAAETDAPETEPVVAVERFDYTIAVTDDTYVMNNNGADCSNVNYGSETEIHAKSFGASLTRYAYFKFDISSLKGDTDFTCIDLDITVKVRQQDASVPLAALEVYGAGAEWSEDTLTFATQPQLYNIITSRDDISPAAVTNSFSITDYVRQAVAKGETEIALCVKEATSFPLHFRFYSKEAGEGAAKLSVYYGSKVDDSVYVPPKEKEPLTLSNYGFDNVVGLNKKEEIRLEAVEDSYVEAGKSSDKNFGSAAFLDFKAYPGAANEVYRIALVKFDISEIKDIEIENASLWLNCTVIENLNVPTTLHVYECFPYDWEEDKITFNTLPERERLIASTVVYGVGEKYIDITEYVKRYQKTSQDHISFWLEGDADSIRRLNFSSKESGGNAPAIVVSNANAKLHTYLEYDEVNPWDYAMENVSEWLNRWDVIKQGGTSDVETIVKDNAEYSLTVEASLSPNGDKTKYTEYPTRNVSTLKDFTPAADETVNYDIYGGLVDESMKQEATGFFYTKKIGDRWWTIDPLGYPFYRAAVVSINAGTSPDQKTTFLKKYGSVEAWAQSATDRLRELGYNSTGGWSATDSLAAVSQPLAQSGILYVCRNYAREMGLDITTGGSTELMYGILPVFDPEFIASAYESVKTGVGIHANSSYIYGWMSDNELPVSLGMLESSLTLDTSDPRFIYGYATAWTFMYMKTGKADVSITDVTDELRREYRAMVYDRYFKIVCQALEKYAPNHQYMGCRFVPGGYEDEYVMRVSGYWCDVITYNYYHAWEPDATLIANQQMWSGKPFIITEWYAKGMDTWEKDNRMTNASGAGWTVKTQEDRGKFYQNYALQLLECKGCVGFDWFQYLDNDPGWAGADLSNVNANKGIMDNSANEYSDLVKYMEELNKQKYTLIKYFDER